jgi:hypothetical protein
MEMTDPSSPTIEPDRSPDQSHVEDSPHRHATLRKKISIKRSTSKRVKIDTTGSTTYSPTSPRAGRAHDDITRSPLYCPVPANADPTVVLVMRFQGVFSLILSLIP